FLGGRNLAGGQVQTKIQSGHVPENSGIVGFVYFLGRRILELLEGWLDQPVAEGDTGFLERQAIGGVELVIFTLFVQDALPPGDLFVEVLQIIPQMGSPLLFEEIAISLLMLQTEVEKAHVAEIIGQE